MPVLDRLRTETRAAHCQLEEAVQIESRVKDVGAYRDLLEKFFGFYEPIERQLQALSGWSFHGIELAARSKIPWLAHDLGALGCDNLASLPRCSRLPRSDSLGRGFGCAYVLEGATLGGRHISAMLNESPVPPDARRFFASYGPAVGDRWKEFIAALENFAAQYGDEEIVEAARDTFTCIHDWVVASKRGEA